MEFRKHTLDNGLEIVAECSPKAYSQAIAFFVNTGSRDESDDVAGVSHFLEHMMFKGTPNRTAADVNRELDEIGSQSNAFTSEEQTVYYAAVLPDYQEEVIDLLADMMRPSLRQDDFDTEKQVIIEEIAKYDDQPPFGAHEKCMALYFGDHRLGNSVLGTAESVSALTRDAMYEYFERQYSPGNMTLAASGNVDFEKLVAAAESRCGNWKSFETARSLDKTSGNEGIAHIEQPSATQQYVTQISNGPAAGDSSRYARRLLATVFGDESGSRLIWELVDPGLAEYAVVASYEYQGAGITSTFLSCSPDSVEENLKRLADLQHEVQDNGITADELELAKSKMCSHLVRRAERPASRLFAVGNNWVQRRDYTTLKNVVEAYQAVTLEDVAQSLAQFPLSKAATVTAGPKKPQ